MDWTPETAREQRPLPADPYDRWVSPQGVCMAEFHRSGGGYLIRFPYQCDFQLDQDPGGEGFRIIGWPAPDCDTQSVINLFHNAIQPILGNHGGGLFLHGSAVRLASGDDESQAAGAVAFLGLSRGGKTTLAGSFAQSGFPFLTEDVIDLSHREGSYWLQPKRSKLRLFADSARFLLGEEFEVGDDELKQDVEAGGTLPFARQEVPLRQIYVLGTDHSAALKIRRLSLPDALKTLMPHAFILDVEDKPRLKGHFARMADLSQDIPCYALDFTRDYAELPRVRRAVLENFASL
jgi:hypothetical protein